MSAAKVSTADYIRVTVIAAWCLTMLWLLTTGNFQKFIAPSLWWLLLLGVICLLAFLIGIMISGGGESHHHGEADNAWVRASVVLMPLAFVAIATPQGSLGGFALEKRSLDLIDGPVEVAPVAPTESDTPRDPGAARELTLTDLLYNLEEEQGFRVTTEGMIFHSKRLGEGQCMLFRFVMTCCAADAMPVSVILVHPEVNGLAGDAWVRVSGTAILTDVRGVKRAVVKADALEVIPEPKRPFLSPY